MRALKDYLESKRLRTYTIKRYLDKVAAFEQWCSQSQINSSSAGYGELMGYLGHLRDEGLGSRSCVAVIGVLRHYYDYLMIINQIESNPARHVRVNIRQWRRPYEILTREQLESLHANYDMRKKPQHNALSPYLMKRRKVTIGLMVYQGLEVQSLARLEIGDIDLKQGRLYVSGGKEYRERYIDLVPVQILELHAYIKEVRPVLLEAHKQASPDSLLVHGSKSYHEAHRVLVKQLKQQEPMLSQLPGGASRQIRASVITHWLKRYNLREVQYLSGYRNVCSVEHYQKNDIETLQASMIKHYPLG